MKPACFGVSICFNPKSKTCKACQFRQACADEGRIEAVRISDALPAADLLKRFSESEKTVDFKASSEQARYGQTDSTNFAMTQAQTRKLEQADGRVRIMLRSLYRQGIDLNEIRTGRIPKELKKYSWLYVACEMYVDGCLTQHRLYNSLAKSQYWADSTARSYASFTTALFRAEGLL